MLKKILIISILFFGFSNNGFANNECSDGSCLGEIDLLNNSNILDNYNNNILTDEVFKDINNQIDNNTNENSTFQDASEALNSGIPSVENQNIINNFQDFQDKVDRTNKIEENNTKIKENNNAIAKKEKEIENITGTSQEELKKKEALQLEKAKIREKNLALAQENFNNSDKAVKLQKKIETAKNNAIEEQKAADEAQKIADNESDPTEKVKLQKEADEAQQEADEAKKDVNAAEAEYTKEKNNATQNEKEAVTESKNAAEEARNKFCAESKSCIDKPSFTISVNDISPGMKVTKGQTTNQNVNFALGTIIQKLMIGLGSFAMIIMTIGAGYIILHSGQDEILSKGKAIFMSGVYALFAALASYYLVSIFRYILFN